MTAYATGTVLLGLVVAYAVARFVDFFFIRPLRLASFYSKQGGACQWLTVAVVERA